MRHPLKRVDTLFEYNHTRKDHIIGWGTTKEMGFIREAVKSSFGGVKSSFGGVKSSSEVILLRSPLLMPFSHPF